MAGQNILTRGFVSQIWQIGDFKSQFFHAPAVQILDIKKIVTSSRQERYRLILSDGEYYIQAMLATESSYMVVNKILTKYSLIRLNQFSCRTINGVRICILTKCQPLTNRLGYQLIGDPENVRKLTTNLIRNDNNHENDNNDNNNNNNNNNNGNSNNVQNNQNSVKSQKTTVTFLENSN